LAKFTLAKSQVYKGNKKNKKNGENFKQNMYFFVLKKKRQQTYNVIFIWDKRPNLNCNPNPKSLSYSILVLNNFDYGKFQFNSKKSYPWFDR
jgi:hypothetical protein